MLDIAESYICACVALLFCASPILYLGRTNIVAVECFGRVARNQTVGFSTDLGRAQPALPNSRLSADTVSGGNYGGCWPSRRTKFRTRLYVKICSLYGVGFYYIPGTDTCIKFGGWVRAEVNVNSRGSFYPFIAEDWNRYHNETNWRTRGMLSFDVRSQTEYGTLRAYVIGGYQSDNAAHYSALYAPRAFIQLAGFTVGLASSFFDFYATPWYSNTTNIWGSDTGGGGQMVWAYTAQFGNGFSASLSVEEPTYRRTAISALTATAAAAGQMWSATCASTRPGAARRSWAPFIKSTRAIMLPVSKPPAIRRTRSAGRPVPA